MIQLKNKAKITKNKNATETLHTKASIKFGNKTITSLHFASTTKRQDKIYHTGKTH